MIPPLPSTIAATIYVAFLATLSCVQFHRSQTPLRLGAAVMALSGLSISALSVVYTTDKVSLSVFWVYQFVAECVAVTWVITTIIHLGFAFYPVTRHQTLIWRTAQGSVVLYDLVAITELGYYCYAVWGSGTLSKEATPILWIYWVPLVRHHHTTGVAMIADSNTLAVGTWYLSALGVTFLGYTTMFIYFMTKPEQVFNPQAQALDLCIRLTACPIFSLPPPSILLRYFHNKYGSTGRDDNPNNMIEEGITNNPRPRRPPMLVSLPTSYHTRRGSIFDFDEHPTYQGRYNLSRHLPFPELDDNHCKRYMDEEVNIGTTSSLDTTAESSPNLKPLSSNSSSLRKEAYTPTTVVVEDSLLSSVSISIPAGDAQSTSSIHEPTLPPTPPLSFNPDVTPDRGEDEETAIAACMISRRLTMERRKDGLDFLNIGGLIKWPHRPNSAVSAPKSTSGNHTFGPLPAIISGTNLLNPGRSRSEGHDHSTSSSGTKENKISRITDTSIAEEDECMEDWSWRSSEHHGHSDDKVLNHDDHLASPQVNEKVKEEDRDRMTNIDTRQDNHTELSDIRTDAYYDKDDSHVQSKTSTATSLNVHDESYKNSKVSGIGRELSMDNIRQMSRNALSRFQEKNHGPVLSLPLITGPLSPMILRTTHGSSTDDSTKIASNPCGDVALEQIHQHQSTRSKQVHCHEPTLDPRNEAGNC
ncbi:hypothetical protein BGZ65_012962 [Modicella reniformis]|uniref:Uncharacterized protein n=1 Tax=Modicella reniformis TaxID=1440133 RepID=A0A9P6M1H5_9FUNG|nr:hypothetical protein BGZ65_012962 [Modicella reniformis]